MTIDEALKVLIARWRAEGAHIDTFHATMGTGYKVCADELAATVAGMRGSGKACGYCGWPSELHTIQPHGSTNSGCPVSSFHPLPTPPEPVKGE